jgi:cysteine synthase
LADDIITVTDEQVTEMTKKISQEQGLFVGYSSGANVAAALIYLKLHPDIKKIATILCDTGYKYSDL